MPSTIKESDWKIFRQLHEVAVERFYENAAVEMRRLAAQKGKTGREQFWDVANLIKKRQKECAYMFDDLRRSTARLFVALIRSRGWITDEEMARFSLDLQASIEAHIGSEIGSKGEPDGREGEDQ